MTIFQKKNNNNKFGLEVESKREKETFNSRSHRPIPTRSQYTKHFKTKSDMKIKETLCDLMESVNCLLLFGTVNKFYFILYFSVFVCV